MFTRVPSHSQRRRLCGSFALLFCGLVCASQQTAAQAVLVLQPGSSASTLAGSGTDGRSTPGDARLSAMGSPQAVAYDASGNLYIADTRNHQVVRVDTSGQLTIVAGAGRQGFAGDGGSAKDAEWDSPSGLAVDASGNIFVADTGNQRVRRIAAADGTVTTVAGSGQAGFSGDGGQATAARLRSPGSLALDASGNLYVADAGNHRVRKVAVDGTISTVAGSGAQGEEGDGGAATAATLDAPSGLALLADGRLLIADRNTRRLRTLQPDGTIAAYSSSGQTFRRPGGLAADGTGSVYVADAGSQVTVQISADGSSPLAGNGEQGAFSTGSPLSTSLDAPTAVATRTTGDVAIADTHNRQVQRVSLATLGFGSIPAGSSSQPQTLTLQNGGTSPLTLLALELPAGFAPIANGTTCAATPLVLQPAAQCTVAITFAPNVQGVADGTARARTLGGAPRAIRLTGTAIAGGSLSGSTTALRSDGNIAYSGAPVTLTATVAGSLLRSPAGNVTFQDGTTAIGTTALSGSTAAFQTASLTAGAHSLRALYSGDAAYSNSTSPAVALTVVPAPDFTMTASAASFSGKASGTVTVPITLLPINGTLNRPVQFAVAGLPAGATATFAPATITLGGDSTTVTLTLQMPATLSLRSKPPSFLPPLASLAGLIALFIRRKRVATLCLLSLCIPLLNGCGSGFRAGATAADLTGQHTYTGVVTATTTGVLGTPLTHTASVGLVITP